MAGDNSQTDDFQPKQFNWIPNHAEAHRKKTYDFIELPATYFNMMTAPTINPAKYDQNMRWLAGAKEVRAPIIHYHHFTGRRSGNDPANFLNFWQGRHRTAVCAEQYSNPESKITVMVERRFVREIIARLECRIIDSVPSFYYDHDGTLRRFQILE